MSEGVAVVGGGAVGLLLGAHFARAGLSVTVITRTAEQARILRAEGIRVDPGDGGAPFTEAVEAVTWTDLANPPPWAVLAVKTPDLPTVLAHWPGNLGEAGVVAMENGLFAAQEALRAFGPGRALVAVTRLGATRRATAHVRQAGRGATAVGALDPAAAAKVSTVAGWFRAAGLPVAEADGWRAVWWKTALNAAINPLAASLGTSNGDLLARTEWHWLLRAVVRETSSAAAAEGVRLDPDALFRDVLDTLRETASNRCSMLVDLESGRPTELDAITGQILAVAGRHRIPADANRALFHLVRARTAYGRP